MFRQAIVKNSAAHLRSKSVTSTRSFHSPFAVLASSPLTTAHNVDASAAHTTSSYEKHIDVTPDPHVTPTGARTYVVSTPDPAHTHYEVPSGAYPNSSPYHSPPATASSGPGEKNDMLSSTSSTLAHANTTSRAPVNESGVGESASVRYRNAPGEMGQRGGGDGGMGLMDDKTTKPGANGELADRNPPPLSKESENISKKGNKNAWKDRK